MDAFFLGFNTALDDQLCDVGYRLEVLAHYYHEVDSSEFSYYEAGKLAGSWHSKYPKIAFQV
ncbi:hypothetical protein [Rubripirellula tenax]|nr:hypothetical protein [Rubripirellula tenax]